MLHARNDEVSILCRGDCENVLQFITHARQADIRDAAAVRCACAGMDVVFHVASLTGVWGPFREYLSINVDGTRNVIDACRAAFMPVMRLTRVGEHTDELA